MTYDYTGLYNHDAERALLCAAMASTESLVEVAALVKPQHLHHPHHTSLLAVLLLMLAERRPIDAITVPEYLYQTDMGTRCGGLGYVMELHTLGPPRCQRQPLRRPSPRPCRAPPHRRRCTSDAP